MKIMSLEKENKTLADEYHEIKPIPHTDAQTTDVDINENNGGTTNEWMNEPEGDFKINYWYYYSTLWYNQVLRYHNSMDLE